MAMQDFDVVQEMLAMAPTSAAILAKLDDGPYRVEDLLATARSHGLQATSRLVYDWISKGLLDHPNRRNVKGNVSTLSREQAVLFLSLLELRSLGKRKQIGNLCNLPVALWLWVGDDFVSRDQARRALQTWTEAYLNHPQHVLRRSTERLLPLLDPDQKARGRRAFMTAWTRVHNLVRNTKSLASVDWHELESIAQRLMYPRKTDRLDGDGQLAAQQLVRTVRGLYEAVVGLDTADDSLLEWGRFMVTKVTTFYHLMYPMLSANQEFGQMLPRPEPSQLIWDACYDTMLWIGSSHVIESDEIGTGLDPAVWRAHSLRMLPSGDVVTQHGILYPISFD